MTIARRSLVLYVVAWVLFVIAAACVGISARGFLASTDLLWAATAVAAAAVAAAVAATLTGRRRT